MQLAVLEGFYGRTWSFEQRHFLLSLLATDFLGLYSANVAPVLPVKHYCYAPKADRKLRQDWQQCWAEHEYTEIARLARFAGDNQLEFSLGFSPLGLYELWTGSHSEKQAAQQSIIKRLDEFATLKISALGLFFDDMIGDKPDLASVQAEITAFIQVYLHEINFSIDLYFCPSYYSFDPVLEELFGKMPTNYWQDLGKLLPDDVAVFWTGDKVISSSYPEQSVKPIAQCFQRPITLWDNSCVHDGKISAKFLPIKSGPKVLALQNNALLAGIWFNPANAFSIAVLSLLGMLAKDEFNSLLATISEPLAIFFNHYQDLFLEQGIDAISFEQKQRLKESFDVAITEARLSASHNFALMRWLDFLVCDMKTWLEMGFDFDPACLT